MDTSGEEKWIMHYSSHHKILLVGEGDFSFALCLARTFGSASNMVATSLDSKVSLLLNYSGAFRNLIQLENLGCTIIHGVDVNSMNTHPLLEMKLYDRIVYNFPHSGFGMREDDEYLVGLHKNVVSGFMKGARTMVTQDGEIHVTHKNGYPYTEWGIVELGEKAGLSLVEEVPFLLSEYPGYVNRRGSGSRCGDTFPVRDSSTFKFSKSDVDPPIDEVSKWIIH